jgi:hypothetical protein
VNEIIIERQRKHSFPPFKHTEYMVYIDPEKHTKILCPLTLVKRAEPYLWAIKNSKEICYNECEHYSYMVFESYQDAAKFAIRYHPFKTDEELMWFKLRNC